MKYMYETCLPFFSLLNIVSNVRCLAVVVIVLNNTLSMFYMRKCLYKKLKKTVRHESLIIIVVSNYLIIFAMLITLVHVCPIKKT